MFIKNFLDFFDNNQAERDILILKVSGCFGGMEGTKDYDLLQSYLSSAKKCGVIVCKAIEFVLAGNSEKAIGMESVE